MESWSITTILSLILLYTALSMPSVRSTDWIRDLLQPRLPAASSTDWICERMQAIDVKVKNLTAEMKSVKRAAAEWTNVQKIVKSLEKLSQIRQPTSQCGGLIELPGQDHELHYQIPQGVQSVSCIWVLWARHSGQIRVRNEPGGPTEFDSTFKLQVFHNITLPKYYWYDMVLGREVLLKMDGNSAYALLLFNAKRTNEASQGFHIKVSSTNSYPTGSTSMSRPTVKFIIPQRSNGTFKYPRSRYGRLERVFIIGRVPDGKTLGWNLYYDTEDIYDYVGISWLDGSTQHAYTGSRHGNITNKPSIPDGSSYILTFISNWLMQKGGFQFNYFYDDHEIAGST